MDMSAILISALLVANAVTVLKTADELLTYEKLNRSDEVRFEIDGSVISPPALDFIDFSVADTTGVARLLLSATTARAHLAAGDRIRVSGTTRLADSDQFYCPVADEIAVLGHSAPPPVPKIGAAEFRSGQYDYRVVSIEGTVREAFFDEICREILLIVLQTGHGFVHAAVGSASTPCTLDPRALLAKDIRITGFLNRHPVSRRSYLGRTLSARQTEAIEFLPSSAASRFDLPDISILRTENAADIPAFGRHRAEGRVLAVWRPRRRFMIRSERGDVVYANLSSTAPGALPHPDASVEIAGYPLSDGFTITLSQAEWRPSSRSFAADEQPIPLPDDFLLANTNGNFRNAVAYNGHVVNLTGSVLRITDGEFGEQLLLLETRRRIVSVSEGDLDAPFRRLTPGCRVSVTGVYSLETDALTPTRIVPQATGFSIVPRTAGDLVLVSRPPWWTPARLMILVGGLLTLIVFILLWNRSLRHLAERRGRELSRRQAQAQRANLKRMERTRLAVELHDAISQNLTGISMQLKAVDTFADRLPAEAARHVAFASKILGSCRAELRNILWDLRHNAIEAPTMNDAIRQTLAPHLDGTALDVDFAIQRSRLDENTAYAILRILRELTANAIRHGHADQISIRTEPGPPPRIIVADNGSGFDPENHPGFDEGHFGLVGIRERVESLGGSVDIASSPAGTTVTLTLPL